jgi:uncharacterized protein
MSEQTHKHSLPRSVDALKLCQQGAVVSGSVNLAELPRIVEQLYTVAGKADAELAFDVDEQSRRILTGQIKAVLSLTCQRCLGGVEVTVEPTLNLAIVLNDEQAGRLPRSLDPLLIEGEELDLFAVVEDELLLSLPLAAHHEIGVCQPPEHAEQEDAPVLVVEKENPFKVLASLKTPAKNADN